MHRYIDIISGTEYMVVIVITAGYGKNHFMFTSV